MKRFILAGLTTAVLYVTATPTTKAEPAAFNPYQATNPASIAELSPFSLVSLANQGQFRAQGIPGFGNLTAEFQLGRIKAKDLVQAAIATNRLPAQAINNDSYLNAVDAQLRITNNIR